MALLIKGEDDLLNPEIRKKLLEEIEGQGNRRRKAEMFKRYECLKDHTSPYVRQLLNQRFEPSTVQEMEASITNISFARKVIDKLAKVYSNGVKRTLPEDDTAEPVKPPVPSKQLQLNGPTSEKPEGQSDNESNSPDDLGDAQGDGPTGLEPMEAPEPTGQAKYQADLDMLAKLLKVNKRMKKWNRYFKAFRNTLCYVKPIPSRKDPEKKGLELAILAPHLYDVVPLPNDPQGMLAVILSDYIPQREALYVVGDAAAAGRTKQAKGSIQNLSNPGADGVNEAIADGDDMRVTTGGALLVGDKRTREQQQDPKNRVYVWWTASHHFTTDGEGTFIGEPPGPNPVEELPFVNLAEDQDEQFFAEGGSDVADSGIRINAFLTNLLHIAVEQGYGQLVVIGKDPPKNLKVGPNTAIVLPHENKDDPTPSAEFKSAGAPIPDLLQTAEMYIALMLSTNNLSTSGVATSLGGGKDFASGVSMILDKAESMEDVNEQAEFFIDAEPEVWCLISKWLKALNGELDESLADIELPDEPEVMIQFPQPVPVVSEKEKLEVLDMRIKLGLSTMLEALMRDDPSLTEKTAEEKLKKIAEEKLQRVAKFGIGPNGASTAPGDASEGDTASGENPQPPQPGQPPVAPKKPNPFG
jgi:hypothetical protein